MFLQHLASNAGKVILNTELLTKVWGPEYRNDLQYLRVWVSRLRSKLEPEPSNPTIIKTLQGIGYLLDPGDASPEADASEDRIRLPGGAAADRTRWPKKTILLEDESLMMESSRSRN